MKKNLLGRYELYALRRAFVHALDPISEITVAILCFR